SPKISGAVGKNARPLPIHTREKTDRRTGRRLNQEFLSRGSHNGQHELVVGVEIGRKGLGHTAAARTVILIDQKIAYRVGHAERTELKEAVPDRRSLDLSDIYRRASARGELQGAERDEKRPFP